MPNKPAQKKSVPTKSPKQPGKPARKPVILPSTPLTIATGHRGRRFHATRKPNGSFTSDPPGFTTEKDPRKQGSGVFFNLPAPTGNPPFHLDLSAILSSDAIQKINTNKRMVFHTVGDTGGVNTTTYQQNVETYMELDFSKDGSDPGDPQFFYHLGDVVYYDGEIVNYYWEFYEPYLHYRGPIFAIPGNHDGDVDPNDQFNQPSDSLKGFVRNFCAQAAVHMPEADDAPRDAMTQPNVYWTLTTPLATFIGLYTNVPEGGLLGQDQVDWFQNELAAAPPDRALILALHHPICSAYGHHPGSPHLKAVIETGCQKANRTPDLILTGHVHDYQRFNASINGKTVVTLVVGAGGYNQKLHTLDRSLFPDPKGGPYQYAGVPDTLEIYNDMQHGYLILDVRPNQILGSYIAVDDPTSSAPPTTKLTPYDTFQIPLPYGGGGM